MKPFTSLGAVVEFANASHGEFGFLFASNGMLIRHEATRTWEFKSRGVYQWNWMQGEPL